MKKLTGWLLLIIMGITACEGPMGPMGPEGRPGESTQWFVEDYDVLFNQWKPASEEGDGYFFHYFEYEVAVPKLTDFVFDLGFVGCYLYQEINYEGKWTEVQRPLPFTIYGFDDDDSPYSENYSFEVRPGYIKFIVKYSDFSDFPPLSCTFHVVMMW